MRTIALIAVAGFLLLAVLVFSVADDGADGGSPAALMLATAERAADATRKHQVAKIETARSQFFLEHNRPPETNQELVDAGFLSAEDIVNAPAVAAKEYEQKLPGVVVKRCGKCHGSVASTAEVGDTCPHCGVVWGRETRDF